MASAGYINRIIFIAMTVALLILVLQAVIRAPTGPSLQVYNHGYIKHGEEYVRAEECGQNPLQTWREAGTNNYVDICKDSAGFWAIFLYELKDGIKRGWDGYERKGARDLSDVADYVKSHGYGQKP